ncbi:MAG: histidine kinase [Bacteroidales bacterium]|nr:histidine kinase [Bacteroidota bacterium]HOE59977.1 histidine kinase [Bacteroidales bacterium]HOU35577.1 histidine kinase [Bacteroidales bacterium]
MKRIFHFFRILMLLLIFEPLQADDVRGMFFYHQRLDDLRQNITKAKNPEEKIRNYLLLSKMYQIISADKASAYADSAIFLSHSAELHSLEADALLLKARVYMIGYVTDSANLFLDRAYNKALKCKAYSSLGYILTTQAIKSMYENDKGVFLDEINQAEKYFKLAEDYEGLVYAYNTRASLYISLNLYEEARSYIHSAMEEADKLNDQSFKIPIQLKQADLLSSTGNHQQAISLILLNIPYLKKNNLVYLEISSLRSISSLYIKLGEYNKALEYAYDAYDKCKPLGFHLLASDLLTLIGNIFHRTNNYDLSIRMNHQARTLRYYNHFPLACFNSYYNLGALFGAINQIDSSLYWLNQAMALANKYNNIETKALTAELFYQTYESAGLYEPALNYFQLWSEYKAQRNQTVTKNAFRALQATLDVQRQKEQYELNTKRIQTRLIFSYLLAGLTLLVIIIALLLIRSYKNKIKVQYSQMRERLLRMQMNPHFIFNALIAIQSYIYKNDTSKAIGFLDDFSNLISLFLTSSSKDFIPLSEELSIIRYYLEIQQLRFDDKFEYEIEVSPELKTEKIAIPPLLIQPFIENSIEHGFNDIKIKGHLKIVYTRQGKNLMIYILDNGIGLSRSRDQNPDPHKHKPMAIPITKERLEILNRRFRREQIQFKVTDNLTSGSVYPGTRVEFSIPLIDWKT